MVNRSDLLDRLHELVGCTYLSDLRDPIWQPHLQQALCRVPHSDYTNDEWSKALSYLFSEIVFINAIEDLDTVLALHGVTGFESDVS